MNSPIMNCQGEVMPPMQPVKMILGACPTCHERAHVYQAVRLTGSAERVWDNELQRCGIQRRREKYMAHSDAVRCCYCHHIRRDWLVIDGRLVRGEG